MKFKEDVKYFFTADEHYWHKRIHLPEYSNRPWDNPKDMVEGLIKNHNQVVEQKDYVFHLGDVCFCNVGKAAEIFDRLNGKHIILTGDHDESTMMRLHRKQLCKNILHAYKDAYLKLEIHGTSIVICHYQFHRWWKSHFNSWNLYGHAHGRSFTIGRQWDVGVDNNNYFPVSFDWLKEKFKYINNPNLQKGRTRNDEE